jgi:hypothetical protein
MLQGRDDTTGGNRSFAAGPQSLDKGGGRTKPLRGIGAQSQR